MWNSLHNLLLKLINVNCIILFDNIPGTDQALNKYMNISYKIINSGYDKTQSLFFEKCKI